MPASEEEKRRMRVLGESLKEAETDELVSGEALKELRAWARAERERTGLGWLNGPDEEEIPELGLHERAKALGLVKPRRRRPEHDH